MSNINHLGEQPKNFYDKIYPEILKDNRLTFASLKLLILLQNASPTFHYCTKGAMNVLNLSKPTIISAMNDLIDMGYVVRHKKKYISKFPTYEYDVYWEPHGKESLPHIICNICGQESLQTHGKESLPHIHLTHYTKSYEEVVNYDGAETKNEVFDGSLRWVEKHLQRELSENERSTLLKKIAEQGNEYSIDDLNNFISQCQLVNSMTA